MILRNDNKHVVTTFSQLVAEQMTSFIIVIFIVSLHKNLAQNLMQWIAYSLFLFVYYILLPGFYLIPFHKVF